MAKGYPVGFKILIPEPVEVKMVSLTLRVRDSISSLERYKGLFTYVLEDDTFYYLSGGVENIHWKAIGKPQAIEILDEFNDGKQTVISGYGLKKYLQENYYTKEQVDTLLAGLQIPDHLANTTPEDIQKLKEIEGDISRRVEFESPKSLWVIQHPAGKECVAFNSEGKEIFGRKISVSNTVTTYNWTKALTGFVKIN